MMLMPVSYKRDLKNPIDQLPFIGVDRDDFEEEANKLGFVCEILPGVGLRGWIITLQVRQSHQLIVHTNEQRKVTKIY